MNLNSAKLKELNLLIEQLGKPEFRNYVKTLDVDSKEFKEFKDLDATLKNHYLKTSDFEKKILEFNNTLIKFAQHDYTIQNSLDSENDLINSLAIGINFLGEELNFSTVTTYYLDDIFNSMRDLLIVIDKQGFIHSVNNACSTVLKYDKEDLINNHISVILPKDVNFKSLISPDTTTNLQYFISRDQLKIPVLLSISNFVRGDEQEIGTVFIARDMTAKIKADEALKQSEQNFRKLYESTSDAVMLIRKNRFYDCNDASLKVFGCKTRDEFYSLHPADVSPPLQYNGKDSRKMANTQISTALRKGSIRFEWLHKRLDTGKPFPAEVLLTAIELGGKPIIQAVVRDITERKRTEEILRKNEARFRQMFNDAPLGYQSLNIDGLLIDVNQKWLDILGYKKNEVLGKWFGNFLTPQYKDLFRKNFQFFKRDGQIYSEFEMVHKNGSSRFIAFDGNIGTDIDGSFKQTHCILKDITELRQTEKALKESEEQLRFALSGTNDGIWEIKIETGEIYLSPRGCEILGYPPESFEKTAAYWKQLLHPDDVQSTNIAIIDYFKERTPIFIIEHRLKTATGQWKWILSRAKAVSYDSNGKALRMVGTITDITERKRAEEALHILNQELEQRVVERTSQIETAHKELETFSYSVSHDLRAPLRSINGFTHILLEDYADKMDDEGKRVCSRIQDNSNRMGRLIDDLLEFSRSNRTDIHKSVINMNEMINTVYHEITSIEARKKISLNISGICSVFGDTTLIKQVWNNLLSNAIKYSSKNEKATISITCKNENGFCIFCIKDNGVGFSMDHANKLFGVFQRLHTNEEFEGTGVGLAIVQQIIHRHGGKVWAYAEVNKGAEFYFSLPFLGTLETQN
ncbi:MAG: PAS domain S-box protein [Bacteroidota bacterium]